MCLTLCRFGLALALAITLNHFLSGTGGGGDMPQWVNTFLASSGNQEAAKRRIESLVE